MERACSCRTTVLTTAAPHMGAGAAVVLIMASSGLASSTPLNCMMHLPRPPRHRHVPHFLA